jgi:uncharacterized protein YecT (DUF1311 family)
MKITTIAAIAILGLWCFVTSADANAQNACDNEPDNASMGQCYGKVLTQVNAEVKALVDKMAADFRAPDARGAPADEFQLKAASKLLQSQGTWETYRDQYCDAVRAAWGTGSGSGLASIQCKINIGRQRIETLKNF